jgi:hypothetical protein
MYPARPGTEKDFAGEWQQQFTRNPKYIQVDIKGASTAICPKPGGEGVKYNFILFKLLNHFPIMFDKRKQYVNCKIL